MKIGIFGDSFVGLKQNPTLSWSEIIASKYKTDVYGITGSNLYYSIQNIKKHHKHYDKIVLVTTFPGRIHFNSLVEPDFISSRKYVPSAFWAKRVKERQIHQEPTDTLLIKALDAAYNYFVYIQDYDYEEYLFQLMLDDIRSLRPDIIIINGFLASTKDKSNPDNNMHSIFQKENNHFNYIEGSSEIDKRNCHMTYENNVIFANKVEQWINGEPVLINLDQFVTPDNRNFYIT